MKTNRPPPAVNRRRTVSLPSPPSADSPGVVNIRVGKQSAEYLVRPLASDFGRGFELCKQGGGGEVYHVHLSPDGRHSCECKGFLRWGHCKHPEALQALINAGKL